ncbi:MAG: phosphatase PAP2 family protein [Halorhabdus sp.]
MAAFAWVGWFAVALVTLLGDPLVLGGVGLAAYWRDEWRPSIGNRFERDRGAILLATILGAVALTAVLKAVLAVERPADASALPAFDEMPSVLRPIYTWLVGPGGYAFPSGHAIAATVGWGGVAWLYGDHEWRLGILVTLLVTAVAASRVVLGVHRPVEVIVGMSLGVAYLLAVVAVLETSRRGFALAGAVGTVGLVIGILDRDGMLTASGVLGAAVGWVLLRTATDRRTGIVTVLGLAGLLMLIGVSQDIERGILTIVGLLGGALIVATPLFLLENGDKRGDR